MTIFIFEMVSSKDAEWRILAKLLDLDLLGQLEWNKPKSNLSMTLRITVSKMILYSI